MKAEGKRRRSESVWRVLLSPSNGGDFGNSRLDLLYPGLGPHPGHSPLAGSA